MTEQEKTPFEVIFERYEATGANPDLLSMIAMLAYDVSRQSKYLREVREWVGEIKQHLSKSHDEYIDVGNKLDELYKILENTVAHDNTIIPMLQEIIDELPDDEDK